MPLPNERTWSRRACLAVLAAAAVACAKREPPTDTAATGASASAASSEVKELLNISSIRRASSSQRWANRSRARGRPRLGDREVQPVAWRVE